MILILGESLFAIKLNYDVNLNPAHTLFLSEEKKMLLKRLRNLEQFLLVLEPLLLLQPRATTVRSN